MLGESNNRVAGSATVSSAPIDETTSEAARESIRLHERSVVRHSRADDSRYKGANHRFCCVKTRRRSWSYLWCHELMLLFDWCYRRCCVFFRGRHPDGPAAHPRSNRRQAITHVLASFHIQKRLLAVVARMVRNRHRRRRERTRAHSSARFDKSASCPRVRKQIFDNA